MAFAGHGAAHREWPRTPAAAGAGAQRQPRWPRAAALRIAFGMRTIIVRRILSRVASRRRMIRAGLCLRSSDAVLPFLRCYVVQYVVGCVANRIGGGGRGGYHGPEGGGSRPAAPVTNCDPTGGGGGFDGAGGGSAPRSHCRAGRDVAAVVRG